MATYISTKGSLLRYILIISQRFDGAIRRPSYDLSLNAASRVL